jgi:hypothetical protein
MVGSKKKLKTMAVAALTVGMYSPVCSQSFILLMTLHAATTPLPTTTVASAVPQLIG